MADTMFRDVVRPSITVGGRRGYTVPLSIVAHSLIIAAVIIVPLVATNASLMPTPPAMMTFVGAPSLPTPPPPSAPSRVVTEKPLPITNQNAAPLEAPHEIVPERPVQANSEAVTGIETGTNIVSVSVVEGSGPPPPPPPPPPTPVAPPAPVRPGGDIKRPEKMRDVRPAYPVIAQAARVEGLVIIEATISPTGKVQDVRLLRSIPLLDAAAIEAVRQWEYTPTLLNGVPVPVVMTVTVQFTLR